MSLLRAQCAARLLPSVAGSARVAAANGQRRSVFSQNQSIPAPSDRERDPNKPPSEKSAMMRHSDSSDALIDHEDLDYAARVDHGSSTFSPVPRRLMDGSEDVGSVAAAVLSGAPVDLQARTVRIYRPTKSAMQSGTWHQHAWQLDWDVLPKGHRWENPLMGWQSSGDYMQATRMKFNTKEDAIRFAEKQGYEWYVQEPQERRIVPKAYANNFMHSPTKLKKIPTK